MHQHSDATVMDRHGTLAAFAPTYGSHQCHVALYFVQHKTHEIWLRTYTLYFARWNIGLNLYTIFDKVTLGHTVQTINSRGRCRGLGLPGYVCVPVLPNPCEDHNAVRKV